MAEVAKIANSCMVNSKKVYVTYQMKLKLPCQNKNETENHICMRAKKNSNKISTSATEVAVL